MATPKPNKAYVILFYSPSEEAWRKPNTISPFVFFDSTDATEALEKKLAKGHTAGRHQWTIVEVEIKGYEVHLPSHEMIRVEV